MIKILAFADSSRIGSYNTKLLHIAAKGAQEAGAEVTTLNLADNPLPIFNADLELESGMSENAHKLKQLFIEYDAFIIASPEYNSAITPLLKNVLDWVSRPESIDEQSMVAFKGKTAIILSASPGYLGGLCGLVFLRMLLANLGVTVLPDQLTISHAAKAFNDDGSLNKEKKQNAAQMLGRKLVETMKK
ncbi:MAG: NAD(P)H-dependent oxidoreductase [Candidatus Tenebribacter davisii]|jgi:NAD(P)H-dependent FMN reductase|nr:NAD(P)H-dependent oxidoreductase [Candidatus Tenebribacter davisii]